jgi:peptidoglycan-N-acetylglucosamine deacetylase
MTDPSRSDHHEPSVFLDATGRRARRLRWTAVAAACLATVVLASFIASLVILPRLTGVSFTAPVQTAFAQHLHGAEHALLRHIAVEDRRKTPVSAGQDAAIAGAWFAPWEDGALDSFVRHAKNLTHVYPAATS